MTEDVDQKLGAAVRELRTKKQMSQRQLGEALGVSEQQIAKYEKGKNSLTVAKLYLLAAALGCAVKRLLP